MIFKVLFILIFSYFALKWYTRYKLMKMQREYQKQHNKDSNESKVKREGDVSVDYIPDDFKNKTRKNTDSEYVDYEEVD